MNRPRVPFHEWLDDKRRSLLDLAREAGRTPRERAESYMLANKARKLAGVEE